MTGGSLFALSIPETHRGHHRLRGEKAIAHVSTGGEPPGPTEPCCYCREPIPTGAVYCKTCEQFQTARARWANQLSFSGLIGALPLLALVYGFVQDRTTRLYSQVRALPVQCGTETLVLGLSNGGNRPAIVAGGSVQRVTPAGASDWALSNQAANGALAIDPAKPVIAPFGVGSMALGAPPAAGPGEQCRYQIAIDVLEFGETVPRKEAATCPCPV